MDGLYVDSITSATKSICLANARIAIDTIFIHLMMLIFFLTPEWTVCTLTLTSATNADKELVISRVTPGSDPVILKIPVTLNEQQEDNIQVGNKYYYYYYY